MSRYKLLTKKARYHTEYLIVASAYKWKNHGDMCVCTPKVRKETPPGSLNMGYRPMCSNVNLITVRVCGGGVFSITV